ncbi:hypothetical protein BDV93DRAFT_585834 [Ceratobasidium sp. AG-I]|nr:hypothetical protein BDV93DRAFT_585834 [Ceratobasidium sp. AG-I]
MNLAPAPKTIVVMLGQARLWKKQLEPGKTLINGCPASGQLHESQVQVAYQFVVDNYRSGDSVVLFGWMWDDDRMGDPRYVALQQLAKALDKGNFTITSGRSVVSSRIPIKSYENLLRLGFNQVLSDFPLTVEHVFCSSDHDAYVVQRGLKGQIKRKEMWLSDDGLFGGQVSWMMALQTSHIIDNNYRSDLFGLETRHMTGKRPACTTWLSHGLLSLEGSSHQLTRSCTQVAFQSCAGFQAQKDPNDNCCWTKDKIIEQHVCIHWVIPKKLALADSQNSLRGARNHAFSYDFEPSAPKKRSSVVRWLVVSDVIFTGIDGAVELYEAAQGATM